MVRTLRCIILGIHLDPWQNQGNGQKGYFAEGKARVPTAEAVSEPDPDEAIVYENFFIASLCMPLHPALANILLHFQA
jgi:hypothetical protein